MLPSWNPVKATSCQETVHQCKCSSQCNWQAFQESRVCSCTHSSVCPINIQLVCRTSNEHLTLLQRRRIIDMGFGGLLCLSAERLESRELLKFLFDRLDPKTMVINVNNKAIHVIPFAVKQVLDLPDRGEILSLHTHTQASKALSAFKSLVGLEESQDLHVSHLQKIVKDDHELGTAPIDDDMAIIFLYHYLQQTVFPKH
ncbi:hypothetical protein SEVIR_7G023200v4 [Setaria viridis]